MRNNNFVDDIIHTLFVTSATTSSSRRVQHFHVHETPIHYHHSQE
jgi:hypothetical protein